LSGSSRIFFVADEAAERARCRVDDGRRSRHGHRFGDGAELQLHIDDGVLADGELHAAAHDRLKTGLRHVHFVLARLQHRHAVAAARVGLELPHAAGRRADHDDLRVRERGAGRIGDDALQAGADGLCVC